MSDSKKVLRPLPQRSWQLTPISTTPPTPATPATPGESQGDEKSEPETPISRTRSILNLTSSTLFGIYKDGIESISQSGAATPWGTGTMTPLPPSSPVFGEEKFPSKDAFVKLPTKRAFQKRKRVDFVVRSALLFFTGLGYGMFISHLHDNTHITPVKLENVNRNSWNYLISWGVVGAVAGNLLPWLEELFKDEEETEYSNENDTVKDKANKQESKSSPSTSDWTQPLRGIGVFIGIAFAIRKLPWESSQQTALTLALANPGLWFIIDKSRMGFIVSTVFALAGTAVLLGLSPDLIPQPVGGVDANLSAIERIQSHGILSNETVGVFTWLASVIFCTCICFRSIGKILAGSVQDG